MKIHQDHIRRVLESKNISFVEIDIGRPQTVKDKEKLLDMLLSPPQIFNNDRNRGVSLFSKKVPLTYNS